MLLEPTTCYRALQAHDVRFDGLFFVAVTTTGIYCRPICPARTPTFERCVFYRRAAEAERNGYRACFRCRPELAPGVAAVDAIGRLAHAAAAKIEAGYLNEASVEQLAADLDVSARHLRRAVEAELGVTPVELAQTTRLALAKHLLQESSLSITEIAFAAGFASVRRFNALFQLRFDRPPSALRREHAVAVQEHAGEQITLRLDYRPPFDWDALLSFFRARAIPGVEWVTNDAYQRAVTLGGHTGFISVRQDGKQHALRACVSLSLAPVLTRVVARLRALFDLDAQPTVISEHLRQDPLLAACLAQRPGLRLPGAFDGFEAAIRGIVGQQISVAAATTLLGRLVRRFGKPASAQLSDESAGLGFLFPSSEQLSRGSVDDIAKLGMPGARARTILGLSRAVAEGRIKLTPETPPEELIARLIELPGIGPWTAHYIALRALSYPNAFPAADLGVRKVLGVSSVKAAEARALAFEPWRGYAVLHCWISLASVSAPAGASKRTRRSHANESA